jgi:ribosome-binding protein aMBF1 (putative translation factor)
MARRRWDQLKRERVAAFQEEDGRTAIAAGYEHARRAHELAEQIRRLREEQGMTQEQLAEKVGTTQPAIARLEAGGTEPRLDTLERIGSALGLELVVRFEPHTVTA